MMGVLGWNLVSGSSGRQLLGEIQGEDRKGEDRKGEDLSPQQNKILRFSPLSIANNLSRKYERAVNSGCTLELTNI